MENDFYYELVERNALVVNKILCAMRKNLHAVSEIDKNTILTTPVLYRWWVPYDGKVMQKLWTKSAEHSDLRDLLGKVEVRLINKQPYCAIYFGKSRNGKERIFKQHLHGDIGDSTLRHTIYSICIGGEYSTEKEKEVKQFLQNTYFEWLSFDSYAEELIAPLEALCIAVGNYPLNIDGNCALKSRIDKDKGWLKRVKELRRQSKKPKK